MAGIVWHVNDWCLSLEDPISCPRQAGPATSTGNETGRSVLKAIMATNELRCVCWFEISVFVWAWCARRLFVLVNCGPARSPVVGTQLLLRLVAILI